MTAKEGNSYGTSCGTSLAPPIAAGAAALTLQARRATQPAAADPSPAGLKAILVATARDLVGTGFQPDPDLLGMPTPYGVGPDFATGFGLVDTVAAVALVRAGDGDHRHHAEATLVMTGEVVELSFEVASGAEPLAVALAWDDVPAMPPVMTALVNDLDLTFVGPGGEVHLPWRLDPSRPSADATRGADHSNNVERVDVDAPVPGTWHARVAAAAVGEGPQRFAVALRPSQAVSGFDLAPPPPPDAGVPPESGVDEIPDAGAADGGHVADATPGSTDSADSADSGPAAEDDVACGCALAPPIESRSAWLSVVSIVFVLLARSRRPRASRPAAAD